MAEYQALPQHVPSSTERRFLTLPITAHRAHHVPQFHGSEPFSPAERLFLVQKIVEVLAQAEVHQQTIAGLPDNAATIELLSQRVDSLNRQYPDPSQILGHGTLDEIDHLASVYYEEALKAPSDLTDRGLRAIYGMHFLIVLCTENIFHPFRPHAASHDLLDFALNEVSKYPTAVERAASFIPFRVRPPAQLEVLLHPQARCNARPVTTDNLNRWRRLLPEDLVGLAFINKNSQGQILDVFYVKDLASTMEDDLTIQFEKANKEDLIIECSTADLFDMLEVDNADNTQESFSYWFRR